VTGGSGSRSGSKATLNERPIIGILTEPGSPAPKDGSYIAASYVKWIEAAGARVVPILYDLPKPEMRRRFMAINGLLLPGGGANLSPGHPFFDAAHYLVDLALDANDKGDYFPVHGTCLGFEALAIIVSHNTSVLSDMDALNAPAPLLYTEAAATSGWLQALPPHVVTNLQNTALAMENHAHGVLTTSFEENPRLKDFFKVLALSLDNKGLPYIAMMEAKQYPVYATQWHPEKNAFEWASFLRIPHSPEGIEVTQEMANFFVGEARKSSHAAADKNEEEDLLIYNWKPEYTGRHESGEEEQDFQQTYIFATGADKKHSSSVAAAAKGLLQRWLSWA
jgi:gamma-glutamyl hydrolase